MVYRMIFNQTAYFGRGAIKEIPGVARSHGFTKAFIVTDPVLLETGTVKKVTDVLDEAGMPYEVFDNVKPNPPVECIQDGVAKFAASGADFLPIRNSPTCCPLKAWTTPRTRPCRFSVCRPPLAPRPKRPSTM